MKSKKDNQEVLAIRKKYIAPNIETINIEVNQSILQGSAEPSVAPVDDIPFDDGWWN